MRFIGTDNLVSRGRRNRSGTTQVGPEEVKSPDRLAGAINALVSRIEALESRTPPEAMEFDVTCPSSGTVTINHGFSGPVRWYVTSWRRHTNAGVPILTEVTTDFVDGYLTLSSGVAGQAVIRIETAQAGQSRRITSSADAAQVIPASASSGVNSGDATDMTGLLKGNGATISAVAAPTGTVVGTTDTQTLSAKTITDLILNGTTQALRFNGASQQTVDIRVAQATSTGIATTTIDSFTPNANCGVAVLSMVQYIRDTEATGAGYLVHGAFKVSGGVVTQCGTVGGVIAATNEDTAGDTALINTSAGAIRVQGTAAGATNKQWTSWTIVITTIHP